MRTIFMVVLAALITLPIFADGKKPTPTPAGANKGKPKATSQTEQKKSTNAREGVPATPTPTPAANKKSQTIYQEGRGATPATVTPTAGPVAVNPHGDTINGSKSNSYREGQPTTPMPTAGPVEGTTVNTSKSNTFKEGQPTTPTQTAGPVEGKPQKQQQQQRYVQQTDPPTAPPPAGARWVIISGERVLVTPTPSGEKTTTINTSKSNNLRQQRSGAVSHAEGNMTTGKVISQSGTTFTVIANGKEVTFSGAKLKDVPKVGEIVDITYTQTPGGPLEVVKIKSTKSNASE